jgi:uncharacterized protein YwgA
VLILLLAASTNGIPGKTALQKIAYFVSVKLKINMSFNAHLYGPYSKVVERNLQTLNDFDFIDIDLITTSNMRKFYKINLNEDGKEISVDLLQKYEKEFKIIKDIVNKCEIEKLDYKILSYAAKIYYILKEEKRTLSTSELIELANYHDWKLSKGEIERAKNLLSNLGVKITTVK